VHVQRVVAWLILLLLISGAAWAAEGVDCSKPLDLANTSQGTCARGELETECGCVIPPTLRKKVEPYYPGAARRLGVKGRVTLFAIIGTDGKVGEIEILKATPENRGFEAAAVDGLKKWRYKPAQLAGKTVAVSFTVTMDFTFR